MVRTVMETHLKQCVERTAAQEHQMGQLIESLASLRRLITSILVSCIFACVGMIGTLATLVIQGMSP